MQLVRDISHNISMINIIIICEPERLLVLRLVAHEAMFAAGNSEGRLDGPTRPILSSKLHRGALFVRFQQGSLQLGTELDGDCTWVFWCPVQRVPSDLHLSRCTSPATIEHSDAATMQETQIGRAHV